MFGAREGAFVYPKLDFEATVIESRAPLIRLRIVFRLFLIFLGSDYLINRPDIFVETNLEIFFLSQGENVELGHRGGQRERARATLQKQAQRHSALRPRIPPRRTERQSSPQGSLAIQPR